MTMLHNLITAKPQVGFALAGSGAVAGLLTFLQVMTPILGFGAALVGFIAGFFTMRSAILKWRHDKARKDYFLHKVPTDVEPKV